MPRKPKAERRRVNGFLVYEDGEACAGCGVIQRQTKEEKKKGEPAGYYLECPKCYKPGCEECMPAGRGCACPDCEAEDEDEDA